MLRKIDFSADPMTPVKFDMDLKVKDTVHFSFTITGEADAKSLKKIVRILKSESKADDK
jgi:hypothetical protein